MNHRRRRGGVLTAIAVVAATTLAVLPVPQVLASPAAPGTEWDIVAIDLANDAVAHDATRDQLLVSVDVSVPLLGNHLVEVDPHTGALGRSVLVGTDAGAIAVAGDGSRAYVALGEVPRVAEIDLDTFTVTRQIALDPTGAATVFARDLVVQPGSPGVIVVSLRTRSATPQGVAVYDEGVRRSVALASSVGVRGLAWSADPAVLYGVATSGASNLHQITVGAAGATSVGLGMPFTCCLDDIELVGGLLLGSNGELVDPAGPVLVGSFGGAAATAADEAQGSAYLHDGTALRRHSLTTFAEQWEIPAATWGGRDLIDVGPALVAASSGGISILGPDADVSGFVAPAVPPSIIRPLATRTINGLHGEDLDVADDEEHVYVVVGAGAPAHGGELVEVEVASGAITRSLAIAGDPHRLAVSDDGTSVLVGLDASTALVEVDVESFTVTRTITLPADRFAGDIEARPGTAASFAVALVQHCCIPAEKGLILVEDGVVAPNQPAYPTRVAEITFAGDPDVLLGHDGPSSGSALLVLDVAASGITLNRKVNGILASNEGELVAADGRVYAASGAVIDPAGPTMVDGAPDGGIPVPVPALGRLLVVPDARVKEMDLNALWRLQEHELDSFPRRALLAGSELVTLSQLGTLTFIPLSLGAPGRPTSVMATPGHQQAVVEWVPPIDDGGWPVTGYTVTAVPGGATCTATAATCSVDGLDDGTSYTFVVAAENAQGSGPASSPSLPVMPSACTTGGPGPFVDVGPAHPFCADVEWAKVEGIAAGHADGTFRSTAAVTRQALAAYLHRFAGAPPLSAPSVAPFSDVLPTHPFAAEIQWLVDEGLVGGYADGTFRPTTPVSRQAMAAVLHRYGSGAGVGGVVTSFSDVPPSHPFFDDITWLAATGIATGYEDGTFRYLTPVSRQAAVAYLHRLDALILS